MAKTCVLNRQAKREHVVARDDAKREALKAIIKNAGTSYEDRLAARDKLNGMDRNGSYVKLRSRCQTTGRPRGVYSKLGLCRNEIRRMVVEGVLPGLRKASW
ncbi:MAG: 30S ribosomal protein S14 [Alphaproteobacteria bacterium]